MVWLGLEGGRPYSLVSSKWEGACLSRLREDLSWNVSKSLSKKISNPLEISTHFWSAFDPSSSLQYFHQFKLSESNNIQQFVVWFATHTHILSSPYHFTCVDVCDRPPSHHSPWSLTYPCSEYTKQHFLFSSQCCAQTQLNFSRLLPSQKSPTASRR